MCFDLTKQGSISTTDAHLREILDARNPADGTPLPIILVGTKADDKKGRKICAEDAAEFARHRGLQYCEVSAKMGLHATQCPFFLATAALGRMNGWVEMTDKERARDSTEVAMLALKQAQWKNQGVGEGGA